DAALDRFPGTRKISAREIERWLHKVVPADKGKNDLKEEVVRYRDEHPPDSSEPIIALQPPPVVAVPHSPAASGAPGRFGAPPPPPPSTGARRKEDWRQSIPDVDNLDQLFEATKVPRDDGSRTSTPGPTAVAPVPKVAIHGIPSGPVEIATPASTREPVAPPA